MNFLKKLYYRMRYGKQLPGLWEERDERNFLGSALINITKSDLTDESFVVFNPTAIDQLDTDFCVGESHAYCKEATEGMPCSGAYIFAKSKKLIGTWKGFGTSILKVVQAGTQNGIPPRDIWSYTKTGLRDFFANWNNIPESVDRVAAEHKSASFWQVDTPLFWSRFDSIRAYLWRLKDKKILIQTGNNAHAITVIGYIGKTISQKFFDANKEIAGIALHSGYQDVLICKDTYGKHSYQEGYRFIGREEAKTLFTPYFSLDIERELAELLNQYNLKGIKLAESPDIYLVKEGEKHLIKNEFAMWCWGIFGYPEPQDIFELPEYEFNKIPTASKELPAIKGPLYKLIFQIVNRLKPGDAEAIINAD